MDMPNLALARYLAQSGCEVDVIGHRIAPELRALSRIRVRTVPKPLNSYLLGSPFLSRAGREVGRNVMHSGGRVVVNGINCTIQDVNWVHYVHAAFRSRTLPGLTGAKRLIEQ